jgi:hypothetical protein
MRQSVTTTDIGTPEHVMEMARQGRLSKEALVRFLAIDKRQDYLKQCGAIEKRFTEACTATGDPCLEGGCAVEGEVCLQPLMNAGLDYYKACGDAFVAIFADARNRSDGWER